MPRTHRVGSRNRRSVARRRKEYLLLYAAQMSRYLGGAERFEKILEKEARHEVKKYLKGQRMARKKAKQRIRNPPKPIVREMKLRVRKNYAMVSRLILQITKCVRIQRQIITALEPIEKRLFEKGDTDSKSTT